MWMTQVIDIGTDFLPKTKPQIKLSESKGFFSERMVASLFMTLIQISYIIISEHDRQESTMQIRMGLRIWFLTILLIFLPFGLECVGDKDINYHFANVSSDSTKDNSIRIPGNYMHAIMVAYLDCDNKLKDRYGDKSTPVTAHVSSIINYSVSIEKVNQDHGYKVIFWPEPFLGGPMKGGGISYLIDANTFEIKHVERSM